MVVIFVETKNNFFLNFLNYYETSVNVNQKGQLLPCACITVITAF